MSESRIAPGPWGWECHPDTKQLIALSSRENDVLLATGDENNSWIVASEAHQRALQALPDLLEALRELLAELVDLPIDADGNDLVSRHKIAKARDAVAKATQGE